MIHLFAFSGEEALISPMTDIATKLGLPSALLAFFIYYHIRVTREHSSALALKDAELARVNTAHDAVMMEVHKSYMAELGRVNDRRVDEAKGFGDKIFDRDKENSALLADVDKTMTKVYEKLRPANST